MTDYLHALPPGYRIEEYELVRVLGSGGFGITYLGYDHHLDKAVAIKEYLPNDLAVRADNQSVLPKSTQDKADYEWGLARFLNEAQTLARFDHRHIIKIHRFFRAHGTGYSVMEYAEGETLSEVLQRKGMLTESELKAILFPILDGLEAVHEADFLHRDIKPGNIVIRDDGSPVLIDFGSARQAVAGKSRSVTAIVTPGYAPIEQYSAKGHQGPWTDIYGLGAVCYRCLTGEPPDDATERLREDPLVPATKRCKGKASVSLLNAIDRALRVDEGKRPQTIAAWRQALTGDGKSGKGATGPAHKPATRPAKSSVTAPAGVSWSDRAMEAVIVVLLGAIAWPIWQLYGGRPGVDKTVAVVEQPADTRAGSPARELAGEMVSIPGGSFRMGDLSGEGDDDELPVHRVTVKPFRLGKYEVTFAQWDACVADGGCNGYSPHDGRYYTDDDFGIDKPYYGESWGRGNRPVFNVSWDDVQSFIAWLNGRTGGNYRLPSEAEWEYAARAGSTTLYSWGDDIGSNRANCMNDDEEDSSGCGDSYGVTAPVGSFPPNAWGLHDMHGNVYEWVQDCWNDSYAGAPTDGSAWESGDCDAPVIRGGFWSNKASALHSSHRAYGFRTHRSSLFSGGFRLAQDE